MTITNPSDAWLHRMADLEDGVCVSVGGLVSALGMLTPPTAPQPQPIRFDANRVALARYVALSRRQKSLTLEDLARRAGIDLAEALQIEDGDAPAPEPRVVFAIASFFKADAKKLMALAGHVLQRDTVLGKEALRFAAWGQSNAPLSQDEERILGEFARVVIEGSPRE